MKILYICRGGVFRSRIAQALTNRYLVGVMPQSSGIEADKNYSGRISAHCEFLLKKHNMIKLTQDNWIQTTQSLINKSDLSIFLSQDVYDDSLKIFDINGNHEIWNIEDINIKEMNEIYKYESVLNEIFENIKENVLDLKNNRTDIGGALFNN